MMLEGKFSTFKYFYFRVNVEDEDLHRRKDAGVTTNFDRTKYGFDAYFMSTHYFHSTRQHKATRDLPDDPRVIFKHIKLIF